MWRFNKQLKKFKEFVNYFLFYHSDIQERKKIILMYKKFIPIAKKKYITYIAHLDNFIGTLDVELTRGSGFERLLVNIHFFKIIFLVDCKKNIRI